MPRAPRSGNFRRDLPRDKAQTSTPNPAVKKQRELEKDRAQYQEHLLQQTIKELLNSPTRFYEAIITDYVDYSVNYALLYGIDRDEIIPPGQTIPEFKY